MIFYVLFLLFILLTTAGKSNSMTIVTFSVSGTEIVGSISGYATHTSLNSTNIKIGCKNEDNSKYDSVTEVTTKFPVSGTAYLSYSGTTPYLEPTESISPQVQFCCTQD